MPSGFTRLLFWQRVAPQITKILVSHQRNTAQIEYAGNPCTSEPLFVIWHTNIRYLVVNATAI